MLMKKKLLYIGNKLSRHGRNETTVETLGNQLQTEGYNIVSVSNKKSFIARMWDMIQATCTFRQVDFILIDTYSTKAFWFAFICSQIARFRKIKYIPILHGGNLPKRLQHNPILSNLIFKNAYKNIAPSAYLKHQFEKAGFNNVMYISNSIELSNYSFKERKTIKPKILWVRAFASIYNPEMAVRVLFEVKKKYPSASLTMVGPDKDGSLQQCRALAKKLGVDVTFTGKLSKQEWIKLSEEFDVFINTTNFDNTPVSVIETMALGLPIVSTNVGGISYLLQHNETALLVEQNNENQMIVAIEEILNNPEKSNKLSLQGRKLANSFDWNIIKEQWIKILS